MADFTLIPSFIAETFGIPEFTAGIILSSVVVLALLGPVLILTKGIEDHGVSAITMIILALVICTALGWLPGWVLLLIVIIIGLLLWLVVFSA